MSLGVFSVSDTWEKFMVTKGIDDPGSLVQWAKE